MSDNTKLTQEEINALLSNAAQVPLPQRRETLVLSADQKDALGEIGNISFGSAATSLSTLLQQRVDITTPTVSLIHADDVSASFPKPYVLVAVEFTAGLRGSNALAIELNDAKTIADLMLGGDGTNTDGELNDLHLSAVAEAMNQMMGGAATSMSTIFGTPINISPPKVKFVDLSAIEDVDIGLEDWIVNVSFQLRVGKLIDSRIMQLIPSDFAQEMVEALQTAMMGQMQTTPPRAPHVTPVNVAKPAVAAMTAENATVLPQPSGAVGDKESRSGGGLGLDAHATKPIQRPDFVDFSQDTDAFSVSQRNLALLFDVNLTVTVELGRAKKPIKEILDLAPGSILELDKLAGEPVDIMVNNKKIAIGEVVVIDENFGVRVTDIISPADRVKNLQ